MSEYDAVVVGAGPNGLAAAIELGRHGARVLVLEAASEPGGGCRSGVLTLPGFTHDLFSAVHPMAAASPFFASLELQRYGLEWIRSPAAVAHPLDDEPAAVLEGTVGHTGADLGSDGRAYTRLFGPLAERWHDLVGQVLAPVVRPPRHPLLAVRFGARAIRSARSLAAPFKGARARALIAGNAGHSVSPLGAAGSGGVATVLTLAGHGGGWPIPRGGAGAIARALVACLRHHGGVVETGHRVTNLDRVPPARATFLDVGPHQAAELLAGRISARQARRLKRFRYGPGVFKLDWALDGPIPWTDPACARAATVHLGGTFEEIEMAEAQVWKDRVSERPFVILAQPSLFDPSRAPEGKHTAWGYCHVPAGWPGDATEAIEAQVERFAPGFRERILARNRMAPKDLEAANANLVGGDVGGGAMDLGQMIFRPFPALNPYALPARATFLCSASTPPGGGVHGMCGFHAARSGLRVALSGEPRS